MRRKIGILCMLTGILLVVGAFALIIMNQQEDLEAEIFAAEILPKIREEITNVQVELPTEQTIPQENIPEEFINPEDLIMTEKIINGYAYIGYLTIPELNLELPVMSGWDSQRLQIAPCRYTGALKSENLVIMAHNYSAHFGRISKLSEGSEMVFTDMDGEDWNYKVVATDILPAEAVQEMTAGEYDLTLFTCTTNRTHRVTVRCDQVD